MAAKANEICIQSTRKKTRQNSFVVAGREGNSIKAGVAGFKQGKEGSPEGQATGGVAVIKCGKQQ